MEGKSIFEKIKDTFSRIFKKKTLEQLPEGKNDIDNTQTSSDITPSTVDSSVEKENSFKESLKIDPNSFAGLDSEGIQKKILSLLGVNPELINFPVLRDKVFGDYYSNIKQDATPIEVLEHFKNRSKITQNSFEITISKTSEESKYGNYGNFYSFRLEDSDIKMSHSTMYSDQNPMLRSDTYSTFNKDGLELFTHHEAKNIYASTTDITAIRTEYVHNFDLTRKTIDTALYTNHLNPAANPIIIDLAAHPDRTDIAQFCVMNIHNEYSKPKPIVNGPQKKSSDQVRTAQIKRAINASKYKSACLNYIKENDLVLYNEFENTEQKNI